MPDQARTPSKSQEPKERGRPVELDDKSLEKVAGGAGVSNKKFSPFPAPSSGDADDRPTEE